MPTSSQSLGMQSSNGQLPSVIGNRPIKPAMLEPFDSLQLPTVQLKTNELKIFVKHKLGYGRYSRSIKKVRHDIQECFDLSAISQLLRIRGIHRDANIDQTSKQIRWKVNSLESFYGHKGTRLERIETHSGLPADHPFIDYKDSSYFPFRNQLTNAHNPYKQSFICLRRHAEKLQFIECDEESADYFKLVSNAMISGEFASSENHAFHIEKCCAWDNGSFRLMAIESSDVGQYKMVPPPGYNAANYRQASPSLQYDSIILLLADPSNPSQFKCIQQAPTGNVNYRMTHAQSKVQRNQTELPSNANSPVEDNITLLINVDETTRLKTCFKKSVNNVNGQPIKNKCQNINGDQRSDMKHVSKNSQSDINMFDLSRTLYTGGQDVQFPSQGTNDTTNDGTVIRTVEEVTCQNDDIIHQDPSRHIVNKNKHDFNRNSNNFKQDDEAIENNGKINVKNAGSSSQFANSQTKSHNFDNWSRSTLEHQDPLDTTILSELKETVQQEHAIFTSNETCKQNAYTKHEYYLADIAHFKVEYRLWKKKKTDNIRLRKEMPPAEPNAICICLRDNTISHEKLKNIVERETGNHIESLQFDPVFVHTADSGVTSHWIVRFKNTSACNRLIVTGLVIDGVRCRIRRYDDVMKEEYEAYKFFQLLKQINEIKSLKGKSVKELHRQQQRKRKTTETPTLMQA